MPGAAPSTPTGARGGGSIPPPDSPRVSSGQYGIEDVIIGVKIFVRKPADTGEEEERWAEILSTRPKPRSSFAPPPKPGDPPEDPLDETEYYVHYTEFNKRLDEWVGGSRLVLAREMERFVPKEEKDKKKKIGPGSGTPGSASPAGTRQGSPGSGGSLLRKAMKMPLKTPAGRKGQKGNKSQKGRKGLEAAAAAAAAQIQSMADLAGDALEQEDEDMDALGEEDEDGIKREGEGDGDTDMDGVVHLAASQLDDDADLAAPSNPLAKKQLSRTEEISRLRTSGSMTQQHSEISRVKNLKVLQIGRHQVEPWYFSPYPEEYAHIDILYICEWCLSFYPSSTMLKRHLAKCNLPHPPGNEIYRDDNGYSFFEIDGRKQRTWCRNLCLLCKCFLDHKTLYFDVDPFMFYCMVKRDESGCRLIGYFSKEKECPEGYNLACILTLPQHQRKGYGKLLIEFSYELSKIEKKQGSPEKPLSDLGLLGYRAYWAEVVVDYILLKVEQGSQHRLTEPVELSIEEMATKVSMTTADVMHTCQALRLIKQYKTTYVIRLSEAVLEQHKQTKARAKTRDRIDPSKLVWKPPIFSRAQLAFGF